MGSKFKTYNIEKLNGKIYTPEFIIKKILDDISFDGKEILGKTILDPACGDGKFLIEVVKRIIKNSPYQDLEKNLKKVYGWDIDPEAINSCRNNLNSLVKDMNIHIHWNLEVCNSLEKIVQDNLFVEANQQKFDYILGNPPYIRIQNLDENIRKFIQNNFFLCKNGSTDIYIAFFELSMKLLSDTGICAFITPNTYFYSEAGKKLRAKLSGNRLLRQLTNYGSLQLFEDATTYSAITIFDKQKKEYFIYQEAFNKKEFRERIYHFDELKDKKFWQLSTKDKLENSGIKLKDVCKIHAGISTLNDRAYIFPIEEIDQKYVYAITKYRGKVKIEKEILKPIVKASTLKSSDDPIKEYILFPFKKIQGKHTIINENDLKKDYPFAYSYLLSIKDILAKRDNGKPIEPWYNFGRTQGLNTSFGKKILFSPMNKKPNFILYENEEATFYSGYCIKFEGDYSILLNQLNSKKMEEYIRVSSRDFRGGWKAYNKKILEEFVVEL